MAPIEQLEFFRDIRPALSYINVPGLGHIPARGADGKRLVLNQKDVVILEVRVLVYGGRSGNKPRKIKGSSNFISTKKDEFLYETMATDAEVIRVER